PGSNSSVEIAKPSELAFIQLKTLERDLSYFDYSNYDSKIRLRTQVSRLGTLLIRWTCIHPKAPTQVTCAHCQKDPIRTRLNIRLPTSVSPEGAAYYTSRSGFVNDLCEPVLERSLNLKSNARARTRACRVAIDARRQPARSIPGHRRQRHRPARRVRRACAPL